MVDYGAHGYVTSDERVEVLPEHHRTPRHAVTRRTEDWEVVGRHDLDYSHHPVTAVPHEVLEPEAHLTHYSHVLRDHDAEWPDVGHLQAGYRHSESYSVPPHSKDD